MLENYEKKKKRKEKKKIKDLDTFLLDLVFILLDTRFS